MTLSKQRPLGGVTSCLWNEVGGPLPFLIWQGNLYRAVAVCRVTSWVALLFVQGLGMGLPVSEKPAPKRDSL